MKMKFVISLSVTLAVGSVAQAIPPIEPPLEAMVTNSNLIVVGTLTNVTMISNNDFDYSSGTILIHEVLLGSPNGNRVRLSWRDITHMICPRDPHPAYANRQSLWFLSTTNGVDVTTGYYGAQSTDKKTEVLKLLNDMNRNPNKASEAIGASAPQPQR